jgi:hypothetical protein
MPIGPTRPRPISSTPAGGSSLTAMDPSGPLVVSEALSKELEATRYTTDERIALYASPGKTASMRATSAGRPSRHP